MNPTTTIIIIFLFIVVLRLLIRKRWDLPTYKGPLLTDHSAIPDLLPEKDFWAIVHKTRDAANRHYPTHCIKLTEELSSLPSDEIVRFNRTFYYLMAQSFSYKLWEAVYALNGGISDDGYEHFRSWLISQGKNKFYRAIKFPRILFLIGVKEIIENYEGIAYCAFDAYQQKNSSDLPQTDDITFKDGGEMFKETVSILRYPELALLAW
jgi:Protein of unknown function (DUF4240)